MPKISGFDTPEDVVLIQEGNTLEDVEAINKIKETLIEHNLKIEEHYIIENIKIKK